MVKVGKGMGSSKQFNYDNNTNSASKIAILGLSNAGKTSIVKILMREFESLTKIEATINVERTFFEILNKQIVIWDFGGQEKYRDKYLNSPERFFMHLEHIYYVIDVQDPALLGSNIMYFQGLIHRIKKYSPSARLSILFHKTDPNLENPMVQGGVQDKFNEVALSTLLEDKIDYSMFYTSIFNSWSIVQAFSRTIFESDDFSENLAHILQSFGELTDVIFASLLTENIFELAYFTSPRLDELYLDLVPEIFKEAHKNIDLWRKPKSPTLFKFGALQVRLAIFLVESGGNKIPFFLLIGYDRKSELLELNLKRDLKALEGNLEKIFGNLHNMSRL